MLPTKRMSLNRPAETSLRWTHYAALGVQTTPLGRQVQESSLAHYHQLKQRSAVNVMMSTGFIHEPSKHSGVDSNQLGW